MNLSTDSLFRKMLHSSAHSPNVSDAEELELLTKFQNLEERSRMKYKKKLDAAKKRITELEKKVSEYVCLYVVCVCVCMFSCLCVCMLSCIHVCIWMWRLEVGVEYLSSSVLVLYIEAGPII